jgi:two-component system phosphate regulon response regulator PhoB
MARVLVIDDDPGLQRPLDRILGQEGHECLFASSGAEGVAMARRDRPDIVLLEWMLPDGPAAEVCRRLSEGAETREIPFVFITGKGGEPDRIRGFELGAADYLVKPFSVRELALRVRAVLRRRGTTAAGNRVEFGCLRIDPGAHRAWVDGSEIELTLLEFKLLVALFEARDRVLTRADLLDRAWGLRVNISTRTVDTHIKRLRDKLLRAGDYVETVRGIGYRFSGAPRR